MREAQVVAGGHAKAAPRGVRHHSLLTGVDHGRLAVALGVGQVHVEKVDLVVAGADGALVVHQEAAVDEAAVGSVHCHRADEHPHAGVAGEGAQRLQHGVTRFRRGRWLDHAVLGGEAAAVLGQAHQLGARRHRVAGEAAGRLDGLVEGCQGRRLDTADAHFAWGGHGLVSRRVIFLNLSALTGNYEARVSLWMSSRCCG